MNVKPVWRFFNKMKFLKSFFKHPWIIITICLVITGFLGFFLKDLKIDNSIRQFLPQKDASYKRLTETEKQFGSMNVIGVSIESNNGDILTPENIEVIRKITDRSLELNDVSDIASLTHIDYVCNQDGSISATQLIPDTYTGSEEDIAQLKGRLSEWSDMYNRVIVNDDNSATQMQITLKTYTAEEKAEMAKEAAAKNTKALTEAEIEENTLVAVRKIVQEETKDKGLTYKIYGDTVITESSRKFMLSDLSRLIPLVIVVVLLSLFFSFKTLDGTLLPLITVVMATIWTCGIMSLCKITFTLVSCIIPVALIAVGSAYGIHVLTHYYVALQNYEGDVTKEQYKQAVFDGLKEVWFAVLLAGITTIVGFISLISSPIVPLHSFAIFTAVGVALSLILAVTFIPAILLCKNVKKVNFSRNRIDKINDKVRQRMDIAQQRRGGKTLEAASGNTLYNIYKFWCGTKPRVIVFTLIILTFSIIGLKKINIDTALVNYFPESSELRQDIKYVDKQFAGTNSIYLDIKGKEKGDITNPELLKSVDDMQNYLTENYESIGKIVSLTTFIKRINQVWHVPTDSSQAVMAGTSNDESTFVEDAVSSWGDDSTSEETVSSWGDDTSTDVATDDEAVSSWGDDTTEVTSDEVTSNNASTTPSDYVDPNIIYSERLSATMTTQQVLDMINQAYVAAGEKYATVEKMVDYLEQETNYNGASYYEIPYNPKKYPVATREELSGVVNGYLTLLSGSLGSFIDDDMNPQEMRITCMLRNHSTVETGKIISAAKEYAAEHFPEGFTIEATGAGEMEYTMTKMIVSSQTSSLIVSLLSVFIIIAISFKSVWAGLLGAVPLALAIMLNYMVMGYAGINLDLITSIIASVAVGVGIDYTIHFLTTYKEERAKLRDLEYVTKQTFKKSGHGIVTNALAVGLGFLVLCFSKFVVLRYIGILVAIVMFTSSALAMTIIPGILNMLDPKFIRPKKEPEVKILTDGENN